MAKKPNSHPCHNWNEARQECGKPATYRYPAMGGGFAYLCEEHGAKHAAHSEHITRGFGGGIPEKDRWEQWSSL